MPPELTKRNRLVVMCCSSPPRPRRALRFSWSVLESNRRGRRRLRGRTRLSASNTLRAEVIVAVANGRLPRL